MSGSDIVFIAATAFALIGSGLVYLFAKSVERRHRPTASTAAAGEEASRPFERFMMRGIYTSVMAAVRAASKTGPAADLHISTATPFARQAHKERETA